MNSFVWGVLFGDGLDGWFLFRLLFLGFELCFILGFVLFGVCRGLPFSFVELNIKGFTRRFFVWFG